MADTTEIKHDDEATWTISVWNQLDKPVKLRIAGVKPGETIGTFKKRIVEQTKYDYDSFDISLLSSKDILTDDDKITKVVALSLTHRGGPPKDPSTTSTSYMEFKEKDHQTTPSMSPVTPPRTGAIIPYGPQPAGNSTSYSAAGAGYSSSSSYSSSGSSYTEWNKKSNTGFVGLSNQGATCYMNSLIQSLYMTPEFRQALYTWSFEDSHARWLQNPANQAQATETQTAEEVALETKMKREKESIPRQLQLLFANLQLSNQKAVKTKRLTKSFGWTDSEAFTQHDVQELLRVLFDALEKVLKGTDQENLINGLYQGEMKDFVRCKECNYESSRSDKYLDIPLVIKGFGETTAVKSVEEALDKFVATELLSGQNLYKCDRCNKMVEAEKGLKFVTFPYLLTLQLKRFDFDLQTERRIKLNDRVTFPFLLDLNHLITARDETAADAADKEIKKRKVDENSDSAEDDVPDLKGEEEEDSTPKTRRVVNFQLEAETALKNGPFVYELFSVLVHKGSALGGHYYAYIKDMTTGQWFEFNDSSVTAISEKEVEETFGESEMPKSRYGGGYMGYSSMWSGGTSAYMLMYRRVDSAQNRKAPTVEQIPPEVKEAITAEEEQAREKADMKQREKEMIEVFVRGDGIPSCAIKTKKTTPWPEFLALVAAKTGISEKVTPENFRLRLASDGVPKQPLDKPNNANLPTHQVLENRTSYYSYSTKSFEVFLETKEPGDSFETVSSDDCVLEVASYDADTQTFSKSKFMAFPTNMTPENFKLKLAETFNIPVETIRVQIRKKWSSYGKELVEFDPEEHRLTYGDGHKIYVEDSAKIPNIADSPWKKESDRRANMIEVMYSFPPDDQSHVIEVSQDMSLEEFREILGKRIKMDPQEFKINKVSSTNWKIELKGDTKPLSEFFFGRTVPNLQIAKGAPTSGLELTPFILYNCEKNSLEDLFQFHVKPNTLISELKVELASKLKAERQVEIDPKRIRVRYLAMDKPTDVFADNKTFKDAKARYYGNRLAIELLDQDEFKKEDEVLITCQQFLPAKFDLGIRTQVSINDDMTLAEFRKLLGEKFGITHVGLYKPYYYYSAEDLLDLPKASWDRLYTLKKLDENDSLSYVYSLKEGDVIFFKDNDEPLKQLTAEEIKEIKKKASKTKSARFHSKEEALTINTNQ